MTNLQPLDLFIEFAAKVQGRSYLCRIAGADVRFTNAVLGIFVDLLSARLTTKTGLSMLPSVHPCDANYRHQLIYRLRRAIDKGLGNGMGHRLILSGPSTSFYLNVPAEAVSVDDSVAELAPHHVSEAAIQNLLDAARANCKRRAIAL